MKIAMISDLHIDFSVPSFLTEEKIADVLLLGGDVGEYHCMLQNPQFFRDLAKRFDKVYAIKGNHEGYNADFFTLDHDLRVFYEQFGIEYLNRNISEMSDGTLLFGCTMWTDFDKHNDMLMAFAERGMNDYKCISYNGGYLTSEIVYREHLKDIEFLSSFKDEKKSDRIYMTHHAPIQRFQRPAHVGSMYESLYVMNLEKLIEEIPEIKLWFSGHTHYTDSVMIGDDQLMVSQCRGYSYASQPFEDMVKIIER